jgi:hypothetical protein
MRLLDRRRRKPMRWTSVGDAGLPLSRRRLRPIALRGESPMT